MIIINIIIINIIIINIIIIIIITGIIFFNNNKITKNSVLPLSFLLFAADVPVASHSFTKHL